MLRLPVKRVDPKSMHAYFVGDAARARVASDHVILDLQSQDEEPDFYEESQGALAALAPVRTDLMRGDLRVAYLAWLLALQAGQVDDDDAEPCRAARIVRSHGGAGGHGRVPSHR